MINLGVMMRRPNEEFKIILNINEEDVIFTSRVLYWWEEQQIKSDAMYKDVRNNKLILNKAIVYINTVNKFLIKVKDSEREMSIDEIENGRWSSVLPHFVFPKLYERYIVETGSSKGEMTEFRKKIIAHFDENQVFGEYSLPPQFIEYNFIKNYGTITRNDLMDMSMSELLAYQIINNIEKRYKEEKDQRVVPPEVISSTF